MQLSDLLIMALFAVFLLALLSFVASALVQAFALMFRQRQKLLKNAITDMVGDAHTDAFFDTTIIRTATNQEGRGFKKNGVVYPSHISRGDFVKRSPQNDGRGDAGRRPAR